LGTKCVRIASPPIARARGHIAPDKIARRPSPFGLAVGLSELGRTDKEVTAMDENFDDKWLTRQELADRYGLPVKTPAEWASKGTGPRYAKFGRHVRYLLSDVMDWERKQFAEEKRHPA
jgi:predicted DNA-binding transcriptional regulator AlpA